VDLIIHMGDQIYADEVLSQWRERLELRASPPTEKEQRQEYQQILEDYRRIYRITFGQSEAQKAMRHAANWMILDDHDIFNNLDFDYLQRDPSTVTVFMAGLRAYYEYQWQLVHDLPEDLTSIQRVDFVREIMNTAFVHLDLRHYRTHFSDATHPMTGHEQFVDFEKFIRELGNRPDIEHIFVVSSVPLMVLTPLMAHIAYIAEKEIYPTHWLFTNNTLALLDVMLPFHNKIKLISGDIHQFVSGKICHQSGGCIDQLVASGISYGSALIDSPRLWLFYAFLRHVPPRGVGEWTIKTSQQVLMRNYGVIKVDGSKCEWEGVFPAEIPTRHRVLTFAFDNIYLGVQLLVGFFVAHWAIKRLWQQ